MACIVVLETGTEQLSDSFSVCALRISCAVAEVYFCLLGEKKQSFLHECVIWYIAVGNSQRCQHCFGLCWPKTERQLAKCGQPQLYLGGKTSYIPVNIVL